MKKPTEKEIEEFYQKVAATQLTMLETEATFAKIGYETLLILATNGKKIEEKHLPHLVSKDINRVAGELAYAMTLDPNFRKAILQAAKKYKNGIDTSKSTRISL